MKKQYMSISNTIFFLFYSICITLIINLRSTKGYSSLTVILLAQTDHLIPELAVAYYSLSLMSLACHFKTTFTDPGSVPESAVPVESMYNDQMCHPMCR